ncbi:Phage protein [plant metagenome]|uniref:Phage protein n=1 Tax=plant metagenome TaxID=1297885 RepID=A0A484XJ21_9ZZZZ
MAVWTWAPDWSEAISETLAWLTDVLTSPAGVEQARALRRHPRRTFGVEFVVQGSDRTRLDLALHRDGGQPWLLPIWPDVDVLPAALPAGAASVSLTTANLDYQAGGRALLLGDTAADYELLDVATVEADRLVLGASVARTWPAGTRIYPVRLARLVELDLPRLTDQHSRASATFQAVEPCDWPVWTPDAVYLGHPVLADRPDESEDLTHSMTRLMLVLDNDVGLPQWTDTAGRAFDARQHRWLSAGRAERARLRSILYYLRGRQRRVWVPTHAEDLVLAADVAAGSIVLDVRAVGLADGDLPAARRHVRIEAPGGLAWHRRIVSASAVSAEVERIEIDAPLTAALPRLLESGAPRLLESGGVRLTEPMPVALARLDVLRISYMALCRGSADSISIEHMTDSYGVARCNTTFQGTDVPGID